MKLNRIVTGLVVCIVASNILVASIALAGGFRESVYGSASIRNVTAFTVAYTNGADRVVLGSVMARSDGASNTWTIAVVNNGQTNILKTGTLTEAAYTLLYEGMGTVPLGAGGIVMITGSVTNAVTTTNTVQYQVHTLDATK